MFIRVHLWFRMSLSKDELEELRRAKEILENPGIAAKLTALAGSPVEKGIKMLPARLQSTVHAATEAALQRALEVAVKSLGEPRAAEPRNRLHQIAAALSGAAGGALINTVFIGHYQDMARGHFVVRRLERAHGTEAVREAYEAI